MRVLGVDPATAKPLGVALVSDDDSRLTVEHSGLYSYVDIPEILKTLKPDLVVIEDQYMFKNYNTAKKLAWSAGKIMGICDVMSIPNIVMNVAHWKAYMKAQKGTHIQRCKEIFGQEYQDDIASAILIATCYLDEKAEV